MSWWRLSSSTSATFSAKHSVACPLAVHRPLYHLAPCCTSFEYRIATHGDTHVRCPTPLLQLAQSVPLGTSFHRAVETPLICQAWLSPTLLQRASSGSTCRNQKLTPGVSCNCLGRGFLHDEMQINVESGRCWSETSTPGLRLQGRMRHGRSLERGSYDHDRRVQGRIH